MVTDSVIGENDGDDDDDRSRDYEDAPNDDDFQRRQRASPRISSKAHAAFRGEILERLALRRPSRNSQPPSPRFNRTRGRFSSLADRTPSTAMAAKAVAKAESGEDGCTHRFSAAHVDTRRRGGMRSREIHLPSRIAAPRTLCARPRGVAGGALPLALLPLVPLAVAPLALTLHCRGTHLVFCTDAGAVGIVELDAYTRQPAGAPTSMRAGGDEERGKGELGAAR
ncbi:hypothetical protein HDZ31DRAFT_76926 [Schizophyllum fasciatum]